MVADARVVEVLTSAAPALLATATSWSGTPELRAGPARPESTGVRPPPSADRPGTWTDEGPSIAGRTLATQTLEFTDTAHLGDLEHAVRGHARVVIVIEPERLGPISDVVDHLIALAARTDAAVLVVGEATDLAPGTEAAITRVLATGVSHTGALLVRADLDAMLQHAELRTDCFRSLAY